MEVFQATSLRTAVTCKALSKPSVGTLSFKSPQAFWRQAVPRDVSSSASRNPSFRKVRSAFSAAVFRTWQGMLILCGALLLAEAPRLARRIPRAHSQSVKVAAAAAVGSQRHLLLPENRLTVRNNRRIIFTDVSTPPPGLPQACCRVLKVH
jgi:hypothetical protein